MKLREKIKKILIGNSVSDKLLFNRYKRDFLRGKGPDQSRLNKLYMLLSFVVYKTKEHLCKRVIKNHVSLLIAAPNLDEDDGKKWGDYFYAKSLGEELESRGYTFSIIPMEDWYSHKNNGEYALYIMGLHGYRTNKKQKNLLWMLYPCVEDKKYNNYGTYDHIFVASIHYSKILKRKYGDKISVLYQAFDAKKHFEPVVKNFKHNLLFVGNTRNEFRRTIRYTSLKNIEVDIIGHGWERYVNEDSIKMQYINNEQLLEEYNASKVVLNDHFPLMKRLGFFNNRIFDVLASKTLLVTDYLPGMEEQPFAECICYYKTKEELYNILERIEEEPEFRLNKLKKIDSILERYSMKVAVDNIEQYFI
jgi:hypothetical protein